MAELIIPEYKTILSLRETEKAIKIIKDYFEDELAKSLNLERVSAPLFLERGSGVNDDLNGLERKASFEIKEAGCIAEGLFSLAKWKRMKLAEYEFKIGEGLYTDMNAIRCDDTLDNLHSAYTDQWDWEKTISKKDRNLEFLKKTVKDIYRVIKKTENMICEKYLQINPILPEDIIFIHTEDLIDEYPKLSPREREDNVVKKYRAIFLIGIGGELKDSTIHDGRAPDYDDWTTPTSQGKKGLNGDILVWYPLLNKSFELSSMGIRVDKEAMLKQLKIRKAEDRLNKEWHKRLINGDFPLSIGGGIGQSRLCMFFLRKAHIGEVQSSVWPEEMKTKCKESGIRLL